jgi:hypothetical protein
MARSSQVDQKKLPPIPRYLKIMGYHWRVALARLPEGELGSTQPLKRLIQIEKSLSEDLRWETFLHEFCHAVLDEIGFENTSLDDDIEELIVGNIGPQIFRTIILPIFAGKEKRRTP